MLILSITIIQAQKDNKGKAAEAKPNAAKTGKDEAKAAQEELKREVHETESQQKYLVCLVLQQVYYKSEHSNLANLLYPLASNNQIQLLDKVLYEHLEHCLTTLTNEDEEFVLKNLKNENELVALSETYTLPQEALSKKLGSLQLSAFQTTVKNTIQKDFGPEFKALKTGQELVKKKLDELTKPQQQQSAEKRSKYSNDRGSKIYKALTWTAVVIGVTIVGSVLKKLYDKNSNKTTSEDDAQKKKQKQEYAQKKKEEKAKQIQQLKLKKEKEARKKPGFQKNVTVKDNGKADEEQSDDDNIGLKQVYEALNKKKEQNKIIAVGGARKPSKPQETAAPVQQAQPTPAQAQNNKKGQNKQQPQQQQQPAKNQVQPEQPQQQQGKGKKGGKQAEPEAKKQKEEVVIQTPAPVVKEPENWTVIAATNNKKKGKKNEGGKKKKGGDDDDEQDNLKGDIESPAKKGSSEPVKPPVEEWTTISEKKQKKKN
jgi:hypothetical protein